MTIMSTWKAAPVPVRWTSLLWFVLGVGAIVSALYSLLTFLGLPVSGMTGIVVIGTALQIGAATLIVLASWKLLSRASWGRVILEIATWTVLVYYMGFGIVWVSSALTNWDEFKTEMAMDLPQVSPELKLIASVLIAVAFAAISVVVIRALRASSTRKYVSQTQ